jgi:putative Mg2+ transporter-C (MgtC) family protein
MLLRLVAAAFLGAMIGLERERHNQPAGLRTHIALAIGACLAMVISINMAVQFQAQGAGGDPARLAAQVVSGIGFLGAGAILRYGETIKGLTTATSLWTVAMIGLAVGSGNYIAAGGAAVLLLLVLTVLDRVEKRFIRAQSTRMLSLTLQNRPGLVDEVREKLAAGGYKLASIGVARSMTTNEATLESVVGNVEEEEVTPLVSLLEGLPGLRSFTISKGS